MHIIKDEIIDDTKFAENFSDAMQKAGYHIPIGTVGYIADIIAKSITDTIYSHEASSKSKLCIEIKGSTDRPLFYIINDDDKIALCNDLDIDFYGYSLLEVKTQENNDFKDIVSSVSESMYRIKFDSEKSLDDLIYLFFKTLNDFLYVIFRNHDDDKIMLYERYYIFSKTIVIMINVRLKQAFIVPIKCKEQVSGVNKGFTCVHD